MQQRLSLLLAQLVTAAVPCVQHLIPAQLAHHPWSAQHVLLLLQLWCVPS